MANTVRIALRNDTNQNWYDVDPVLIKGEAGYDSTLKRLKIGDGTTHWKQLEYTPTIINASNVNDANAALSAAEGKRLADRITTLENKPSGSSVNVINNLTSTSTTDALSAAQGKALNDKIPTVSTATNSTSTTTAASSSAVKAAYDLANTANSKIPSGTILTSSNYSNYAVSQGVTNVDGYLLTSGSVTVPSGGTWLVICFIDGVKATSSSSGGWIFPMVAVGLVAGGTKITESNAGSYLKCSNQSQTNNWFSTSYTSSAFSGYLYKKFVFLKVK